MKAGNTLYGSTASAFAAVLALAGAVAAQGLIEKTGTCPELTRGNTYNGVTVNMTATGQNTTNRNWPTNGVAPPDAYFNQGHIQNPLNPFQSINCVQVPAGLRAQIVASELTPGPAGAPPLAYLMHFTFDERGRVWAVDTRDYPATHNATGTSFSNPPTGTARLTGGQSRVVILEDTSGNGSIDRFKVFHTGMVIPTSIEVVKNGVIMTVPPYIYYLPRSASNPDTAGAGQIIVSSMGSAGAGFDTHFQTNSLERGIDNWIYGHGGSQACGGSGVTITGGTKNNVSCGGGNMYRFKAAVIGSDTTRFEVVWPSGPSNAHGIGQMEDGQWFKSGATLSSHSNHMVRLGQTGQNDIRNASGGSGTSGSSRYYSLTPDLWMWEGNRDPVGNYFSSRTSAVSGHDFYKARLLPQKYWNRFAFTCEGSTKLCNQDSLVLNGSTWSAHRLYPPGRVPNIFASADAWTAPLKARTGPEGGLWVLDWYNYSFLHNPASPATNGGWNTPLRAKSRVRLYRILPAEGNTDPVLDLANATTEELVATLFNTNFVWRLHAQRLLIERGYNAQVGDLLDSILTHHRQVDAVGIDGPVLHALWTLEGMRRFELDSARWNPVLRRLLLHPAWTVRRNVVLAMPGTGASYESIREMCAVNDVHAHVRVQALQNLTRMPASGSLIQSLEGLRSDTHITAAYTAAGGTKVTTLTGSARPGSCPAYLDTVTWTPVNVSGGRAGMPYRFRNEVRYDARTGGFDLVANAQLASGELLVHDLRGKLVFRSTWNQAANRWSRVSAENLAHPVYVYTFRTYVGDAYTGRIGLAQTY